MSIDEYDGYARKEDVDAWHGSSTIEDERSSIGEVLLGGAAVTAHIVLTTLTMARAAGSVISGKRPADTSR